MANDMFKVTHRHVIFTRFIKQMKEIYYDKFQFISLLVTIVTIVALLVLSYLEVTNLIVVIVWVVMVLSEFTVAFAMYTRDIRALERELGKVNELQELDMSFPKDMILSFLTNTRIINDNERFFNLVYASVQELNRKEALFALVRIKNYKEPVYLRDTFIIFYGMVSLSWYFTHRKKIYAKCTRRLFSR